MTPAIVKAFARRNRDARPGHRYIVVRDAHGKIRARIPTTWCSWCTDRACCSACHATAERARAGIARSDAKRAARALARAAARFSSPHGA